MMSSWIFTSDLPKIKKNEMKTVESNSIKNFQQNKCCNQEWIFLQHGSFLVEKKPHTKSP